MVNFVITLKNYLACCGELMNINIPTIYTHSKTQSGYIYSDETVPDMVNEAVKLKYFLLFYLLQGEVYHCLHEKRVNELNSYLLLYLENNVSNRSTTLHTDVCLNVLFVFMFCISSPEG